VSDPRLTEERLRYYLDSNQVMRERMCLALLPLLGPFSQVRPRRPRGGPDGARDLECLYENAIPTWGAVGFRNGGGNDAEARNATMKKFQDDLDAALKENASLRSFAFFTNVDLTPGQKEELEDYAQEKGVAAVQVFDMEILRNALDSPAGLLVRNQFLDIPLSEATEWTKLQSSKIASYEIAIRLPLTSSCDSVLPEALENFHQRIFQYLSFAFGHTCLTTPCDDFVFLLSVERAERDSEPGYGSFILSIHCHITAFVKAFQEWCDLFISGSREAPPSQPRSLPGDQVLDVPPGFGKMIAHRIKRSGPNRISMQHVRNGPALQNHKMTTSGLLCVLSGMFNHKTMIWDDAERSPDVEKVMSMVVEISDRGFAWDAIQLDRSNPESWEYAG